MDPCLPGVTELHPIPGYGLPHHRHIVTTPAIIIETGTGPVTPGEGGGHGVPLHSEDEFCKHGCLKCMAATTSFRWILVILSLLGVCCVVTGIVLAALHATGQSFLFLAIMFIGLGVLLVVVVAVGWRCTPRGHEPLHALFGLGDFRHHQERSRGRSRHHGRRSRDSHWYGGMMYPEFQYRRPPPSYNASMQDFQHQLVLAQTQRERFHSSEELPAEDYSLPSSPPPSYRSRASTVRTGIQITFPPMQGDNSHPPTYRSHVSTMGQHAHSRPSLPRDGFSTHQNGSSANNTRVHSRNNSAGNFRVHSRSGSNVGNNSNTHSRTNSAGPVTVTTPDNGAIVTTIPVSDSPQDELLVQQTLQTLEDATSSAGIDNLAQDTQGDEDDDEYPMETPL
ncbi:hypothetical protein FSP39_008526 [Pinctada imbricata]|uniref:Uncharacterized protein n=1 Tax=Pinctada imbricata TaxID=66713 RepID=A0AA88XX48_PINIB|nr:hypothetical protein FSP39_008526 [Pinctada imbricata]